MNDSEFFLFDEAVYEFRNKMDVIKQMRNKHDMRERE